MNLYDEYAEKKSAAIKTLLWDPVKSCMQDLYPFSRLVDEYIDMDYVETNEEYRIKPEKDEQLLECWNRMQKCNDNAQTHLASVSSLQYILS